jgi:hypothetical protein
MQVKGAEIIVPVDIAYWQGPIPPEIVRGTADAIEAEKILYVPGLPFELSTAERPLLSPDCLDGKAKNVSYRPVTGVLTGTRCNGSERDRLLAMLRRYYTQASELMRALLQEYADQLTPGFTSFRPVEIGGREISWRYDDARLHLDAFPSRPTQGQRILRVFTNVNPRAPRVWRVGEAFERVAARFLPGIRPTLPGSSWLLNRLRIVKGRRTEYDHLMLGIHDQMKSDERYQSRVAQTEIAFPPGATWLCFTDSVSHAAVSGQFAIEQTFYLPVKAMKDPERSPLRMLERLAGRKLA